MEQHGEDREGVYEVFEYGAHYSDSVCAAPSQVRSRSIQPDLLNMCEAQIRPSGASLWMRSADKKIITREIAKR